MGSGADLAVNVIAGGVVELLSNWLQAREDKKSAAFLSASNTVRISELLGISTDLLQALEYQAKMANMPQESFHALLLQIHNITSATGSGLAKILMEYSEKIYDPKFKTAFVRVYGDFYGKALELFRIMNNRQIFSEQTAIERAEKAGVIVKRPDIEAGAEEFRFKVSNEIILGASDFAKMLEDARSGDRQEFFDRTRMMEENPSQVVPPSMEQRHSIIDTLQQMGYSGPVEDYKLRHQNDKPQKFNQSQLLQQFNEKLDQYTQKYGQIPELGVPFNIIDKMGFLPPEAREDLKVLIDIKMKLSEFGVDFIDKNKPIDPMAHTKKTKPISELAYQADGQRKETTPYELLNETLRDAVKWGMIDAVNEFNKSSLPRGMTPSDDNITSPFKTAEYKEQEPITPVRTNKVDPNNSSPDVDYIGDILKNSVRQGVVEGIQQAYQTSAQPRGEDENKPTKPPFGKPPTEQRSPGETKSEEEKPLSGIIKSKLGELEASASDTTGQVNTVFNTLYSGMEKGLFEFVKTGKLNFRDLADSIINDLIRIAIQRMILAPILGAIGDIFSGGAGGALAAGARSVGGLVSGAAGSVGGQLGGSVGGSPGISTAYGAAFYQSGIVAFARGGIVSRPTLFPFANGIGLMGEAGPEAIMPLSRTSRGELGVKLAGAAGGGAGGVIVNIYNQSGQPVKSSKTETSFNGQQMVVGLWLDAFDRNMMGLRSRLGG